MSKNEHMINSAQHDDEYPSFFRCIDALCAACGGAVDNVGPAVLMKPFGWIHVWVKGNGHMKCAAERLWQIVPEKLNEGRVR